MFCRYSGSNSWREDFSVPKNAPQRFIRFVAAAGILLFLAATASMIVAISPFAEQMSATLNARAAVIVGAL
jgi:Na+/H+ antiporter NhaA